MFMQDVMAKVTPRLLFSKTRPLIADYVYPATAVVLVSL